MSKLVIVGSCAFDAIETPFGKTDKIIGGASPYIGLAAAQFDNVDPAIVAVVGDDFPQEYLDFLAERGINTDGIEVVKGGKTFFWSGKYHNDMNSRDTLATELNVLADFSPKVPASHKEAPIVMLGNLQPQVQLSVIEQMDVKPKLVILDTMNFWMDIALDELKTTLKKVDVITINDEEARQLSGEYSLVTAAKKIHEMGPKYVVIKKGEHGALIFEGDKMFFAPALPLSDVFDPTGAGDTFAGGFAGYIAQAGDTSFETMKTALIYGSCLASFTVEKFGTERLQSVTPEEIKERLHQFKQLVQFDININD
ncbi:MULTISPECIES: PfkB family carbohydrate kinase [Dokdonia]|jgi:sugar/nucleoside kinase (ribokinase family)|uniref:Sugar kinase n=3 Tax=Dokdonia TaxID=326319 RepID=A0A0A2H2Q4_9FLAO|nr:MULTISPECIES: PfkB family carbohydrate kinase [Dokdonia]ANH59515.1 putative sugar kinase YdjH [Dokdonia donghaensis DSW-1]EAQ39635.1 PfkB family carbohydrate kinase [Dokdonia sp. MED134]KGO06895.1 sugar kinase [Dokdonia donghaensis DSW-1]